MDLKIDFGTEEKDTQHLNLFATIKYNDQTEQIPLRKTVTKDEQKRNTEELQHYLREIRTGLNNAVKHLKEHQMEITVKTIKDTFIETVG